MLGRMIAAVALVTASPATIAPEAAIARSAPAVHPVSGLPVIGLTIGHGSRLHRFRVELASTGQQQAMGLMFRRTMAPDEGMIFPMDPPRLASFWMRNTVLPLDIVFIGVDGRIITIAHGTPFDETPIPSGGIVKGVLELNAGRTGALHIVVGDSVRW